MTVVKYVAFDLHIATISIAVLNLEGELVTQAVIKRYSRAEKNMMRES